jgi:hypothetical protein
MNPQQIALVERIQRQHPDLTTRQVTDLIHELIRAGLVPAPPGWTERSSCGCPADIPDLIRRSGTGWVHLDRHGDAYAATEDADYPLPACDECYGAVGPYSAAWVIHEGGGGAFRCAGCLRHDLQRQLAANEATA